jgi:hypothetical protein
MAREDYETVVKDAQRFRAYLDDMVTKYLELFPAGMEQGYWLYGWERQSVKMPEVADLKQWAQQQVTGPALQAVLILCSKAHLFVLAFDHPLAYLISYMLDRQLDAFDRCLYAAGYFHGSCPPNTKSAPGPCSKTAIPTARVPNPAIPTCHLFTNSMVLSITITGFTMCSSLLH